MATEEAIAAGLIDWINSLSVADPLYTIDDFTNGDVVWKALRALLPLFGRIQLLMLSRTDRSLQLPWKASRES